MANKKTTTNATATTENVVADSMQDKLDAQNKQIEDLTKLIASLQSQLASSVSTPLLDDSIFIGARMQGGIRLCDKGENIVLDIPCDECVEVNVADFRAVLSSPSNYKALFKNDILYFEDEENYKRFRLKKEIDLSSDEIKTHLLGNADAVNWLKTITNNKKEMNIYYAIIQSIARLEKSGELHGWEYKSRASLEEYIGEKFTNLIMQMDVYTNI